jgi:hypothetical protein
VILSKQGKDYEIGVDANMCDVEREIKEGKRRKIGKSWTKIVVVVVRTKNLLQQ